MCGPFKVGVIPNKRKEYVVRDVQRGKLWGSLFLSDLVAGLLLWAVIITVWEVTRILSSSVEYLSARLYNSSIVVGGSRDSEWKNGVVGPKLLQKF